ncbi:MAG: hypothetical protein ABI615_12270 [Chthoniobacterales bacterium]
MTEEARPAIPRSYIIVGLICGLLGMLFWLLPPLGFPVSLMGFFFAASAIKGTKKRTAIFATLLCVLGLTLCLANVGVRVYVYKTGKPKILKEWLDQAITEEQKQFKGPAGAHKQK